MEQAVLDSLRSTIEASADTDLAPDVISGAAHPDIVVVPAPFWETMKPSYSGPDGVRDYFADLKDAFGHMHYELIELTPVADAAVAHAVLHVDGKDGGTPTELHAYQALHVKEGRLSRVETFLYRQDAEAAARRN